MGRATFFRSCFASIQIDIVHKGLGAMAIVPSARAQLSEPAAVKPGCRKGRYHSAVKTLRTIYIYTFRACCMVVVLLSHVLTKL